MECARCKGKIEMIVFEIIVNSFKKNNEANKKGEDYFILCLDCHNLMWEFINQEVKNDHKGVD